ncbi:hypothetical protein [Actinocorallia longicatena]|uniref:Uncharacterized protein n=1 Tax=Actinocorallia longicatena TaxID=111803 RepID=A0ABP6QIE3_9ACTN
MKSLLAAFPAALLAVPATAASAAEPIWQTFPSGKVHFSVVESVSPRATWFLGADAKDRPVARRWDGRRFHRVALPRTFAKGYFSDAEFSSPKSGWAVAIADRKTLVLRWNGRSWKVSATLPESFGAELGVVGPKNVLVAGVTTSSQDDGNWRYDGTRWRKLTTGPSLHSFSGRYALDLDHERTLLRWTGRAWKGLRVPGTAGVFLTTMAARGSEEIWAVGEKGAESGTSHLFHWNGGRWSRERIPLPTPISGIEKIVPDGRGGLWLSGTRTVRDESSDDFGPVFLHRSAVGKYGSAGASRDLYDFDRVPGTTTLWGVGSYGSEWKSAIFRRR